MRARIWLLTGVLSVAMTVFGLPAAALAHGPGRTESTGKARVQHVCGAVKKGEATCFALRRTDIVATHGLRPADTTPTGYGPADLHSAYNLPADGGAGATVAIVDAFDDPNAESDLALYRQQYGLPECTTANGCFRKVDQTGGTSYPAADTDWAGEISLDVDMVSAAAPQAHILLVEADDNLPDNLGVAVDEAVALGAKYVSNSYGSGYSSLPGSGEDPSELTDGDAHYNHPGVAVVASTGDYDYGVAYPAASQYVTAVGGTSLARDTNARGWSESVWNNDDGNGPGSGCSLYEPKPAWQTDTGCAMRTEADVSAVADPATGVAVYDSFGFGGWNVFGGTSAASPLIAAVYADAGTPVGGTYPSSYPYAETGSLNDVTTGNNGTCSPAYLCTAGAGYDGPTGLGSPNGLAAFKTGPHGEVSGTVRDAATGVGIPGATVRAGSANALADAQGHYDLIVPVGSYDMTAEAFGYKTSTVPGVAVTDGGRVTEDFALSTAPRSTVSGTVTDGSGHDWPLYATITADGVPGGPVFTDPVTGHYSLNLPQGQTYHLHVTPAYPGYQTANPSVTVTDSNVAANVSVPVDTTACDAPGYQANYTGPTQTFDGGSAPTGWSVDNAAGTTTGWAFDDPADENYTGGSGNFAIVDNTVGGGQTRDSTLTAPVADLSADADPTVSFDTDYVGSSDQIGDVDISVDGGANWTNVWHHTTDYVSGPTHLDVPIPQAARKPAVLTRFHFVSNFGYWWELDNVFIGNRSCDPIPGGLVTGQVTDANTRAALNGAVITTPDSAAVKVSSAATPQDAALGDGFYWLFSPVTGSHPFSVAKLHYSTATRTVKVAANRTTEADFSLKAGRVTVTPTNIAKTVDWDGATHATVTLKNTGTAPATVTTGEDPGRITALSQGGAPLQEIKGTYSAHAMRNTGGTTTPADGTPADTNPAGAAWTPIANFPLPVADNLVGVNGGKVYSAFGFIAGTSSALYVYDPDAGSWSQLTSAADPRDKPSGGFIGGKLYAAGGWGSDGDTDPKLEIYDPATDSWSTGADEPTAYAGSGAAVLNNKLYVIGGCTASACGSKDVQVYDPATDSWSAAAAYPEPIDWASCGAITGKLYCAGGQTDTASSRHAYVYDPASDTWSPLPDMPIDLWGSTYAAANGLLLVSGGITTTNGTHLTNQGYAYDPTSNTWTALPNANIALYRSGSACGLYQIGGAVPPGPAHLSINFAEVLPGFTNCDSSSDVSWMSESRTTLTLQPGASATVTVTMRANVPAISQPGTYQARVILGTDTPYLASPVSVAMTVNPPKQWGKVTGTVTSATDGSPLAGATVRINGRDADYTVTTDKDGRYALWLDSRNNPLTVTVVQTGYQTQTHTVKIAKGTTTTSNFVLRKQ
ncbi:carboxypeptidase regulatory-like domain-containing protein [Rugosimonospora africana]|uniref:carboxypeptidase regulatory-like domain-containing protein n=1 Tax=Rugosimonospora africana TaxID=556532 RepID=UPI001EF21F75|nr:carboxypeptidase regulatory-like domain-containing protein [Rugosimonospora africana]